MSVVTLPYQKLKAWKKLRLEVTIGKWPEAQGVAASRINFGSVVVVAASMLVSQAEIFFMQRSNIAMKITGAIEVNSATGRNKFTVRQWVVLIGLC